MPPKTQIFINRKCFLLFKFVQISTKIKTIKNHLLLIYDKKGQIFQVYFIIFKFSADCIVDGVVGW